MGSILTNGVFLPAEGERNCYEGLAANWVALDGVIGGYSAHAANLTIHVTAEDKQAWDTVTNKANDADVMHLTGNEIVGGQKTLENLLPLKGEFLGTEASNNGRTLLYFIANRDTQDQSGIYLTKFRQDKAQGSMSGNDVAYLSFDCLENSVRTNNGLRINFLNFVDDIPQQFVLWSGIAEKLLGTASAPWSGVYATNYYYGNDNVEFSTKFVTTDTTQTISGAKTFTDDLTVKGSVVKFSSLDTTEGSTTYRTDTLIKSVSTNNSYGLNALFGASSSAIFGAGEGKNSLLTELAGTANENVYIISDDKIYFHTNANTYRNKKTITLGSDGTLTGLAGVTATTFTGNLTGDCSGTADKATKDASGNVITSTYLKNSVTNSQTIKSTAITRGTAPSSAQTFGIPFTDNNNKYIGNVYGVFGANMSTFVGLYAYKGSTTSNGDNVSVRVGYDVSGNAYTYAPTPATTDNSTQIATTAFVKAQGYLGMPDLSNGVDISSYITDLAGGTNNYTPTVDGYISLCAVSTGSNGAFIKQGDFGASGRDLAIRGTRYAYVYLPVVKNVSVDIVVVSNSIGFAKFYPCQGNV